MVSSTIPELIVRLVLSNWQTLTLLPFPCSVDDYGKRTKWKPLELSPHPCEVISQVIRQPEEPAELSATFRGLRDANVVIPGISPSYLQVEKQA